MRIYAKLGMKKNGLSYKQLSEITGISVRRLKNSIDNGKGNLNVEEAIKIIEPLKIFLDDYFYNADEQCFTALDMADNYGVEVIIHREVNETKIDFASKEDKAALKPKKICWHPYSYDSKQFYDKTLEILNAFDRANTIDLSEKDRIFIVENYKANGAGTLPSTTTPEIEKFLQTDFTNLDKSEMGKIFLDMLSSFTATYPAQAKGFLSIAHSVIKGICLSRDNKEQ